MKVSQFEYFNITKKEHNEILLYFVVTYLVKNLIQVTEEFIYRNDKIKKRVINFTTGWVVETFARGRAKFLKGRSFFFYKIQNKIQ